MARARLQLPDLLPRMAQTPVNEPVLARGAFARSAYDAIRAAILDCTLLPGTALSEQALSEGLGVSRAPVRDALRQLAAEGLVHVQPQRGTLVSRIDPIKVRDAIFVREVLECRAAELACAAPTGDKALLPQLLEQQSQASAHGDYHGHLEADEALHRSILELAGHPHAWPALRLARTGMNRIRHLAITSANSPPIAVDQHRVIVQAILDGDAAAARSAMQEHIRLPLRFLESIAGQHPDYIGSD
jgi:GntR family transcriptional regulator, rspAB operon transcriptional repressor